MPLRVLGLRTLMTANLVRGVLVTGSFATFFLGALYFEHVRGLSPIQIGLLFMIMNIPLAIMSTGLTAKLIGRFGAKNTLVSGIALVVVGMLFFSQAGPSTPYFPLIVGAFILMGIGFGATLAPLMVIAMDEVPHRDAGLASGTIQVSLQLSAAAGIALLGTIATDRTRSLHASGQSTIDALSGGYHLAFGIGAGLAALGLAIALFLLPRPRAEAERDVEEVPPIAAEHA